MFMFNRSFIPGRWLRSLFCILGTLLWSVSAWAQGLQQYRFYGQVSSLNPASDLFPGIGVGSSVEGVFTLDYSAGQDPVPTNQASYRSAGFAIDGMIGGSRFFSVAYPGSHVIVTDGSGDVPEDWTIINLIPGGDLAELRFTFYDGTGQAIHSAAIPNAAELNAFALKTLYLTRADGSFGFYRLDLTITPVPEPSALALCGVGVASMSFVCRRRG